MTHFSLNKQHFLTLVQLPPYKVPQAFGFSSSFSPLSWCLLLEYQKVFAQIQTKNSFSGSWGYWNLIYNPVPLKCGCFEFVSLGLGFIIYFSALDSTEPFSQLILNSSNNHSSQLS